MASGKLMNIITLCVAISLIMVIMGGNVGIMPIVNAQNNTSSSQLQNATENTGAEKKSYVLIFGQRIVGNIDNSTKIVSSIVDNNLIKIEEEFLVEISLAPSQ